MKPVSLTLYGRAWCHLCEDMRLQVDALRREFDFGLTVVDVDDDEALAEKFDLIVPVLLDGSVELCRLFYDDDAVRRHLSARGSAKRT